MTEAIPARRGSQFVSQWVPGEPLPVRPKPPRLTADEFIALHKGEDEAHAKAYGAAGSAMVRLLDDGMRDWLERAHRKFIAAGGYGLPVTAEEAAEMRAAGVEPTGRVQA